MVQRALITGSARGLGLAIARALGRAGVRVIISDKDASLAAQTAAELRKEGLQVECIALDVTDAASVAAVRDTLLAHGPVDIVVNNAGVVFGGPFQDVPPHLHKLTIDVNVMGVMNVIHAFLPHLRTLKQAHIVNISSASAYLALPNGASYAASKWAVLGLSQSLRDELALQGASHVHVATVCPSYISTGLFDGARPALLTWMLTPEDVANSVLDAIRRRKALVILPWTASALIRGCSWMPSVVYDRLCRVVGVNTSMLSWKGRGQAPPPPPSSVRLQQPASSSTPSSSSSESSLSSSASSVTSQTSSSQSSSSSSSSSPLSLQSKL